MQNPQKFSFQSGIHQAESRTERQQRGPLPAHRGELNQTWSRLQQRLPVSSRCDADQLIILHFIDHIPGWYPLPQVWATQRWSSWSWFQYYMCQQITTHRHSLSRHQAVSSWWRCSLMWIAPAFSIVPTTQPSLGRSSIICFPDMTTFPNLVIF